MHCCSSSLAEHLQQEMQQAAGQLSLMYLNHQDMLNVSPKRCSAALLGGSEPAALRVAWVQVSCAFVV
jgi:hypothetical protein